MSSPINHYLNHVYNHNNTPLNVLLSDSKGKEKAEGEREFPLLIQTTIQPIISSAASNETLEGISVITKDPHQLNIIDNKIQTFVSCLLHLETDSVYLNEAILEKDDALTQQLLSKSSCIHKNHFVAICISGLSLACGKCLERWPEIITEFDEQDLGNILTNSSKEILNTLLATNITQEGFDILFEACVLRLKNMKAVNTLSKRQEYNLDIINSIDNDDKTLLHYVCKNEYPVELLQILLKLGANPNIETYPTPLQIACLEGDIEKVKLLMDSGTSLDIVAKNNKTLLHLICKSPQAGLDLFKLVYFAKPTSNGEKWNIDCLTSFGTSPLLIACVKGKTEIVHFLLDEGADYKILNEFDEGVLIRAAQAASVEIFKLMLEKFNAATPTQLDDVDLTHQLNLSLNIAANKNCSGIFELIIDKVQDYNYDDYEGNSALHHACRHDNEQMVRNLVLKGANLEAKNDQHETPLLLACKKGSIKTLRILLEQGCVVNIRNAFDFTPLQLSIENHCLDTVKLLIKYHADIQFTSLLCKNPPLHTACERGTLSIVAFLLSKGANPNAKSQNGDTALHRACFFQHLDIVECLLSNESIDVNCVNFNQSTPLHIAAQTGNATIIAELIRKGAKINHANQFGLLPLYMACFEGKIKVAELLYSQSNIFNYQAYLGTIHGIQVDLFFRLLIEFNIPYPQEFYNSKPLRRAFLERLLGPWILSLLPQNELWFSLNELQKIFIDNLQTILSASSNPIKIGLFIHSEILIALILASLTNQEKLRCFKELHEQYPKGLNYLIEQLITADLTYSSKKSPIQEKIDDLSHVDLVLWETIFSMLNFEDPLNVGYVSPEQLKINNQIIPAQIFKQRVRQFLSTVIEKAPLFAGPLQGTPAHQEFYSTIERQLKQVFLYFQQKIQHNFNIGLKNRLVNAFLDLASVSGYCATQYQITSRKLYMKFCLGKTLNFRDLINEQLDMYLDTCIELMTTAPYVNQRQSSHAAAYFRNVIHMFLGIPIIERMEPLPEQGFINGQLPKRDILIQDFHKNYKPIDLYHIIWDVIQESSYAKELYLDWCKKNLKKYTPTYETLSESKKEIRSLERRLLINLLKHEEEQNEEKIRELYLERKQYTENLRALIADKGFFLPKGYTGSDIIQDEKNFEILEWLINKKTGELEVIPFLAMLLEIGLIQWRNQVF